MLSVEDCQSELSSLLTEWSTHQICDMQSGEVARVRQAYPRNTVAKMVLATYISLLLCDLLWLSTKLLASTIQCHHMPHCHTPFLEGDFLPHQNHASEVFYFLWYFN